MVVEGMEEEKDESAVASDRHHLKM